MENNLFLFPFSVSVDECFFLVENTMHALVCEGCERHYHKYKFKFRISCQNIAGKDFMGLEGGQI